MKIEHVGLHAKRLHPDAGCPIEEVIFARRWAEENQIKTGRPTPLIGYLIGPEFTQRDAEVAATIVQWLGSHVGQSFVDEAMKEAKRHAAE